MKISRERKGALAILGTGMLWGTIGLFVTELAARGSTPALTGFMRMGFSFLMVAPIAAARHSLWVDRRALFSCALLGLLAHAPFNVLHNLSLAANGVALAVVLTYASPVFTALASMLLFGEKLSRREVLSLALNILGCVLAVTGGDLSFEGVSVSGVLYGLGAGFTYSMIAILGKVAGDHINAFAVSAWSYFFAALALLAVSRPPLASLNLTLTGLGFLYAFMTATLPYLLYYWGLQRVREVSQVPVLASIELVAATAIGLAFYHEPLQWVNLAGIVLVLASILTMRS